MGRRRRLMIPIRHLYRRLREIHIHLCLWSRGSLFCDVVDFVPPYFSLVSQVSSFASLLFIFHLGGFSGLFFGHFVWVKLHITNKNSGNEITVYLV